MKYFTFKRENNNFDDILNDQVIKKIVRTKIKYPDHLMIGIDDYHRKTAALISYITVKYSDDQLLEPVVDFSPKPGVDYFKS